MITAKYGIDWYLITDTKLSTWNSLKQEDDNEVIDDKWQITDCYFTYEQKYNKKYLKFEFPPDPLLISRGSSISM